MMSDDRQDGPIGHVGRWLTDAEGRVLLPHAVNMVAKGVGVTALDAYHARMTAAIRTQDPNALVFGEPYVLFNFGSAPTTVGLPGG